MIAEVSPTPLSTRLAGGSRRASKNTGVDDAAIVTSAITMHAIAIRIYTVNIARALTIISRSLL